MVDDEQARQLGIRVRDILEVAPDAMLVVDDRGIVRLANGAVERLFGWSRDDLLGQPVEVLIPLRLRHGHARHREEARDAPVHRPIHARLGLVAMRKDGTEFAAEVGLAPVRTDVWTGTVASIRDVTERVALEESLQQANRQRAAQMSLVANLMDMLASGGAPSSGLRDALAATARGAGTSTGAVHAAGEDGALRLVASVGFERADVERLADFFGRPAALEGLARRTTPMLVGPDDADADLAAVVHAAGLASLLAVPLGVEGGPVGVMWLGAAPGDRPSPDALVFARAVGRQVTQSLQLDGAFRALAASERRYRTLMDRASDAIAILTVDGQIREVNRRAVEILGLPAEEVAGRHVDEFAARPRDGAAGFRWVDLEKGDEGPLGPLPVRRPDGSVVLVEATLQFVDIGDERLVLAIGRDVTEQVRAREHLMIADRMASIGTLAAGVAHEINNPLTAVVANLELAQDDLVGLLDGPAGPALREVAEMHRDAFEAAHRVREIVRDLKVFSRSADERTQAVDVHRVLDSSARMARNEIRHAARLVKDYATVPRVRGNESRLGQVFLNLLVNAAQAIPEGLADQNEIRVSTRVDAQGRVAVEIADTGVGMPPETLRRLFTPFFTTKEPGVGTGLGLAIVQRIVTEVGGEVEVDSAPGRGTRFTVYLAAAEPDSARPATAPPREGPPARRGRLLVVDDEVSLTNTIRRALERDHEIEVVTEAEAALRRIAAGEHFDFIVCDLMMPVMTGMDLHAALRVIAPQHADDMVFITGGGFTPRARAFLDEVPNARLDKPFEVQALRDLIQRRLR